MVSWMRNKSSNVSDIDTLITLPVKTHRPPGVNPVGLLDGETLTHLYSMHFGVGPSGVNRNSSRLCSCESLGFKQPSTPRKFYAAESKGVPRGAPGRAPGPEPQIPTLIEIC